MVALCCVSVLKGASWCSSCRGLLHPAGGCCSSSHCSAGTCVVPQELFGFTEEITVLGQPPAPVSAISDGCAKDRRGLRGQQECSGDPWGGGCPPLVPRRCCGGVMAGSGCPLLLARAEQLQPLLGTQGETRSLCLLRLSPAGPAPHPQRPTVPGCCQAGLAGPALGVGPALGAMVSPSPRCLREEGDAL